MSYGSKQHQRTIDKIHLAVRLEQKNPNMLLGDIADTIGLSKTSFSLLRKTKAFHRIKNVYLTGLLSKLDEGVSDTYNLARQTMEISVPVAMQNLLELALNAKNEQVKLKASVELLNRHGKHPAISRTNLVIEKPTASSEEDDQMAATLLVASRQTQTQIHGAVLNQAPTIDTAPITDTKQ